ncbi:DUF1489 family protein [Aurantimonas sp. Leaf443]|uniref:DUF1489 family protein n=1 Tax=Aurantimonas sp. Leaf443 TaxID=1736378 RepID=UPI0006F2B115|nr:DUF1489 family protein [Aurantimonas sp. Leaf443]KQT83531.1 lysophospholipase [Aurantimonas sp. Leaf443]
MPLHLIKLCVGVESVEDLEAHVAARLAMAPAAGQRHTTRMVPKRADEIVGQGSLYWVIKGQVQVRQKVLALEPFTDGEGIGRCHIVLEPVFVRTQWQPRRAFQGWRYLLPEEAPPDEGEAGAGLPAMLRRELADLGLL